MSKQRTNRSAPAGHGEGIRELELRGTINFKAAEAKGGLPTFTMLCNTGEPMILDGWPWPVVVDFDGAEFAKSPTPCIEAHDRGKRIGHTTQQRITTGRAGKITARGVVSATGKTATEFVDDGRNGFPFETSLGARSVEVEFVEAGQKVRVNGRTYKGPLEVSRKTLIRELTVDVLGADPNTETRIAAAERGRRQAKRGTRMARKRANANDIDTGDDELHETREIEAAEIERIESVKGIFNRPRYRDLDVVEDPETGRTIKVATFKAKAVRNGLSANEVELALMQASFPGEGNDGPAIHVMRQPEDLGRDEGRDVLSAALLCRGGYESAAEKTLGPKVMQAAAPYRACSLVDLARIGLQMEGKAAPYAAGDVIKASFSNSSNALAEALTGGIDKLIGFLFAEAPQTWRSFAAKRDLSNFRTNKIISPEYPGELEKIGSDGDITHGWIKDGSIELKAETYAKVFGYSRQKAKDDDLSVFNDVSRVFVNHALRKQNDLVWGAVLANAGSHFSLAHANLIDDPLSLPAVSTAVTAMRKQRDSENNDLDIMPAVIAVPPELETTGRQILNSIEVARSATSDNAPTGNPMNKIARLEVEPRLSNDAKFETASALGWYLFAGMSSAPAYVGYVDGRENPFVEFFGLDHDAQRLGFSWRVYLDFAAGLGEWKSGVHSSGDNGSS